MEVDEALRRRLHAHAADAARRGAEDGDAGGGLAPDEVAQYKRRIAGLLAPGETVLGALRRLGACPPVLLVPRGGARLCFGAAAASVQARPFATGNTPASRHCVHLTQTPITQEAWPVAAATPRRAQFWPVVAVRGPSGPRRTAAAARKSRGRALAAAGQADRRRRRQGPPLLRGRSLPPGLAPATPARPAAPRTPRAAVAPRRRTVNCRRRTLRSLSV